MTQLFDCAYCGDELSIAERSESNPHMCKWCEKRGDEPDTFTCKSCGEQFDSGDESVRYPKLCMSCGDTLDDERELLPELETILDGWVETHRAGKISKLIDFARQLDTKTAADSSQA
jgi:hypothetical protein